MTGPNKKKRILYKPTGRALEYADWWALNIYSGCPHGCRYCYAAHSRFRKREDFHASCVPVKDCIKRLERDCAELPGAQKIFLSFSSDPWPMGIDHQPTIDALKVIHDHGHSVRVLSKGNGGIIDYLKSGDEYWVTLTLDYRDVATWEPRAAPNDKRLDALTWAKRPGLTTGVSFEPVIDPQATLDILSYVASCGLADSVRIGCSNHLGDWNWPSPEWEKRVRSIDWPAFAFAAAEVCRKLQLAYRLKDDLAAHLPADKQHWRESPGFGVTP